MAFQIAGIEFDVMMFHKNEGTRMFDTRRHSVRARFIECIARQCSSILPSTMLFDAAHLQDVVRLLHLC